MKGVAIPVLVALIIGIIIMAIMLFLVYKAMQGESWECQKCRTQFATWCSQCFKDNVNEATWMGGPELGEDLNTCVKECNFWPSASGPEQDCQNAEDACRPFNVIGTE